MGNLRARDHSNVYYTEHMIKERNFLEQLQLIN